MDPYHFKLRKTKVPLVVLYSLSERGQEALLLKYNYSLAIIANIFHSACYFYKSPRLIPSLGSCQRLCVTCVGLDLMTRFR